MARSEPFQYEENGVTKSLLGDGISGLGGMYSIGTNSARLLIRSAASSQVALLGTGKFDKYLDHLRKFYDNPSVVRHSGAIQAGGIPIMLWRDGDDLVIENDLTPPSVKQLNGDEFCRRVVTATHQGPADATDAAKAVDDVVASVAKMTPFTGEYQFVEELARPATKPTQSPSIDYWHAELARTTLGQLKTGVAKKDPYLNGTVPGSAYSVRATQLTELLRPGWCLFVVHVAASGTQSGQKPGVAKVFRLKLKGGARLAHIGCSIAVTHYDNSDSDFCQIRAWTHVDSWVVRGSALAPLYHIRAHEGMMRGYGEWNSANTVFGGRAWRNQKLIKAGYESGASQPALTQPADFSAVSASIDIVWDSNVFSGTNSVTFTTTDRLPQLQGHYVANAISAYGLESTFDAWLARPARDAAGVYHALRYGRPVYSIGFDMCSNRLATYQYRLADLGEPVPIEPGMTPLPLTAVKGKITSAKFAAALLSLQEVTGQDTTNERAQAVANPRIYYGGLWAEPWRPMLDPLKKTQIYQQAAEAGESVDGEIFLKEDPDDVLSKEMTFKQANEKANQWYLQGSKWSIVVAQPDSTAEPVALFPARVMVDQYGRLAWSKQVDGVETPLSDADELAGVLRTLQAKGAITVTNVDAVLNHPDVKNYVQVGPNPPYDGWYDPICVSLIGMRYGEITQDVAAAAEQPLWTVSGQLREGFLKHPDEWSPEFWLATGGAETWKIERYFGSLVANPFGVGVYDGQNVKH